MQKPWCPFSNIQHTAVLRWLEPANWFSARIPSVRLVEVSGLPGRPEQQFRVPLNVR